MIITSTDKDVSSMMDDPRKFSGRRKGGGKASLPSSLAF